MDTTDHNPTGDEHPEPTPIGHSNPSPRRHGASHGENWNELSQSGEIDADALEVLVNAHRFRLGRGTGSIRRKFRQFRISWQARRSTTNIVSTFQPLTPACYAWYTSSLIVRMCSEGAG